MNTWRCHICGKQPHQNYMDSTGEPLYYLPDRDVSSIGDMGVGYNIYFCSPHHSLEFHEKERKRSYLIKLRTGRIKC